MTWFDDLYMSQYLYLHDVSQRPHGCCCCCCCCCCGGGVFWSCCVSVGPQHTASSSLVSLEGDGAERQLRSGSVWPGRRPSLAMEVGNRLHLRPAPRAADHRFCIQLSIKPRRPTGHGWMKCFHPRKDVLAGYSQLDTSYYTSFICLGVCLLTGN